MKNFFKDILEFAIKNKVIIAFVVIIVFLYAIGLIKIIAEALVLILLVSLAIYFGKKIQDGKTNLKDIFRSDSEFKKRGNVYYYEGPKDKENKKTK